MTAVPIDTRVGAPALIAQPARPDPVSAEPGAHLARRYDEAVAAVFARRPQHLVPGLARISALCAALGEPQHAYPVLHVTGTNAKTTLTRMVAALLDAHGLVVGATTSPHLQDVRERVRIGGEAMSQAAFVDGYERLRPHLAAIEAAEGHLVTFFETMTALALAHFADVGVDAACVEVGIGGRLDATNVCPGQVAVIGPIGLDHPELGATVAEVAVEKAGIIKPGATVVSAAQEPAAAAVLAAAARRQGARLLLAGRDFAVVRRDTDRAGQWLTLRAGATDVEEVHLGLHGAHQADNAACALAAAAAFLGDRLDPDAVRAAFATLDAPGRFEVVSRPGAVPVLLDGAHNPAAMRALAVSLAEVGARRRIVVLGAMADKDVDGLVAALAGVADHIVATTAPSVRGAPAARLAAAAQRAGIAVTVADDAAAGLAAASALAGGDDVVVVTGSLYTVGAARDALGLSIVEPAVSDGPAADDRLPAVGSLAPTDG